MTFEDALAAMLEDAASVRKACAPILRGNDGTSGEPARIRNGKRLCTNCDKPARRMPDGKWLKTCSNECASARQGGGERLNWAHRA